MITKSDIVFFLIVVVFPQLVGLAASRICVRTPGIVRFAVGSAVPSFLFVIGMTVVGLATAKSVAAAGEQLSGTFGAMIFAGGFWGGLLHFVLAALIQLALHASDRLLHKRKDHLAKSGAL
jgi:hypothetical protein